MTISNFPPKISANQRYFTDAEGQPFFWLGDTAWPLFTQYTIKEAQAYLVNRARKGFTVIQGVIAWFGGTQPHPSGISPNEQGEFPWLENDPTQPNPAFFRNVDALLTTAKEYGLTLAILPTWGNFVTDAKFLNAQNAWSYGDWLGQRYRDQHNLIWINGGDCLPYGFEDVFDALADGLHHGDGGTHLITYHPCALHSSAQLFGNRS